MKLPKYNIKKYGYCIGGKLHDFSYPQFCNTEIIIKCDKCGKEKDYRVGGIKKRE